MARVVTPLPNPGVQAGRDLIQTSMGVLQMMQRVRLAEDERREGNLEADLKSIREADPDTQPDRINELLALPDKQWAKRYPKTFTKDALRQMGGEETVEVPLEGAPGGTISTTAQPPAGLQTRPTRSPTERSAAAAATVAEAQAGQVERIITTEQRQSILERGQALRDRGVMVMDDTLGMPRQLEASDVAVLQGYEGTNDQFMELVDKLTGPSKLFADMEENIEASVRMGIPREEAVRDVLDAQVYLPREMRGTQREQNELVSWAVVMAPLKRDLLLKQLALADAELAAARKIAKTGKPIPASTRGKLETDRITTRTNGASTLVNVAQAKGLEVGKHGEIITRSGPIGWLLGHMYGTPGAFAKPKGERIRTSDLPPGETIFTYDAAAAMLDPMNPESFDAMERYGFELPKSAGDIGNPAYIEKNLNRYSKYLAERYGVAPTIDTVSVSVRDKEGGIVTKEMNKQQLIGHIADTQSKLAELDRILGGAPGVAEVTEEAGGTEGLVGRPVGDFYTPKSEVNVFTPVIESKSAADQDITSFLTDVMDDTEDKLLLERLESELGLSPED